VTAVAVVAIGHLAVSKLESAPVVGLEVALDLLSMATPADLAAVEPGRSAGPIEIVHHVAVRANGCIALSLCQKPAVHGLAIFGFDTSMTSAAGVRHICACDRRLGVIDGAKLVRLAMAIGARGCHQQSLGHQRPLVNPFRVLGDGLLSEGRQRGCAGPVVATATSDGDLAFVGAGTRILARQDIVGPMALRAAGCVGDASAKRVRVHGLVVAFLGGAVTWRTAAAIARISLSQGRRLALGTAMALAAIQLLVHRPNQRVRVHRERLHGDRWRRLRGGFTPLYRTLTATHEDQAGPEDGY